MVEELQSCLTSLSSLQSHTLPQSRSLRLPSPLREWWAGCHYSDSRQSESVCIDLGTVATRIRLLSTPLFPGLAMQSHLRATLLPTAQPLLLIQLSECREGRAPQVESAANNLKQRTMCAACCCMPGHGARVTSFPKDSFCSIASPPKVLERARSAQSHPKS